MKKIILGVALVIAVGSVLVFRHKAAAPADSSKSGAPSQSAAASSFNKQLYSNDKPDSIWMVANKQRPLKPANYIPGDLTVPSVPLRLDAGAEQMHVSKQAAPSIQSLFAAAKQAGFTLQLDSGYRSYTYQKQLYDGYVAKDGVAAADRYSARPGTSEHQTGFALDVVTTDGKCQLDQCFGTTAAGQWLAAHAYEYGFIIRYTKNKEAVTGYEYEPWHLRFVGTDLSNELHRTGVETLEEFFSLPGGPNY